MKPDDLVIMCVLRSGGVYTTEWANKLLRGLIKHTTRPFWPVCLTDLGKAGDWDVCPLKHNWPGWWSKLECFNFDAPGSILFLDLDTVIVRSIDELIDLIRPGKFYANADFMAPHLLNSAMMGWHSTEMREIYEVFAHSPERYMRRHHGDQNFIGAEVDKWSRWPTDVSVSYKMHCRYGGLPRKAAVVQFHGRPKPDEVDDEWVREAWI